MSSIPRALRGAARRLAGLGVYVFPVALLAGVELVYLLLALNPEIPVSFLGVVRYSAFYATLATAVLGTGLLAGTALFLLARGRRVALAPVNLHLLAWLLAWTGAAMALCYWYNTIRFQFYLPPRVNRLLVKSAIVLTVGALVYAEVALFHSLRQRRFRWPGRLTLLVLPAFILVFLHQRQTGLTPPRAPASLGVPAASAAEQNLLVVGIDGATLDHILPLAGEGDLPFFSRLMSEGAYGRLASVYPQQRLSAWTSLATGKLPYKHGIMGGTYLRPPARVSGGRDDLLRLLPRGLHFRKWGRWGAHPVRVDARLATAKPLWGILPGFGMPAGVANWPVSAPAAAGAETGGFFIPPQFFSDPGAAASVEPRSLAARARHFDLDASAIDPEFLGRFVGNPGVLQKGPGSRIVVDALAHDLSTEALAFFLIEAHRVRFGAIVLDGLRGVLSAQRAVEEAGTSTKDRARWEAVVRNYYIHFDEFLAELWLQEGGEKTLVVVSALGEESFPWHRELRQLWLPSRGLATSPGASDGIFFMLGGGVRAGTMIDRATILDVAPTLLFALGLPVARDMDGEVMVSAFEDEFLEEIPVSLIPTYEDAR